MDFKSIGLKTTIAATVAAGTMFAVAPVQAATVGSVSFGGLGELTSVKGSEATDIANIAFNDGQLKINSGTGDFTGYVGGTAKFFNNTFSTALTNRASFITLSKAALPDLTFDLTKFINPKYVELGGSGDSLGQFTSRVSGIFNPGSNPVIEPISAFATIKQNGTLEGNFTNITLTTVPTPALLPGLIGMGVAAWRKRKGEVAEQADS